MRRITTSLRLVVVVLLLAVFGASIPVGAARPQAPISPTTIPSEKPPSSSQTPSVQPVAASRSSAVVAPAQYPPCSFAGSSYTTTVGSDFTFIYRVPVPSNPVVSFHL